MGSFRWLLALLLATLIHAGVLVWFGIAPNNSKEKPEPFENVGMVISLEDIAGESGGGGSADANAAGSQSGLAPTQIMTAETLKQEPIAPTAVASLPEPEPEPEAKLETKPTPSEPPIAETFEIPEAELRAIREAEMRAAEEQKRLAEERRQLQQQQRQRQRQRLAEEEHKREQRELTQKRLRVQKQQAIAKKRAAKRAADRAKLQAQALSKQVNNNEQTGPSTGFDAGSNSQNPAETSNGQAEGIGAGADAAASAGSGGNSGGGNAGSATDLMKAYRAQIYKLLAKNKKYPKRARQRGLQGGVLFSFIVNRSGNTSSAKILQSSGHSMLDQATLRTLRKTTLPPPPAELAPERSNFAFEFTLSYRLR